MRRHWFIGGCCDKRNIYIHTHTHIYIYIYIYMYIYTNNSNAVVPKVCSGDSWRSVDTFL